MPELCSREAECSRARSHVSRVVLAFWTTWDAFWRRKTTWDAFWGGGKSADSRIFGEKGRCVARPQHERCRLADFRRKRKSCGATSLPFLTRGFSAKRETVWRDLPAIFHSRNFGEKGSRVARPPEILYFFVYQYRLNAPMGEVNRQ